GYAELWEPSRGVIDTIRRRRVDFKVLAVAPLAPSSACLVRAPPSRKCPCCMGTGGVVGFDEALLVGQPPSDVTSEQFFHPEALKVLRGERRSTLLPFLKRMTEEGLWPKGRSFAQLGADERRILMHGYWHRPGPGSFLKTPKSDPEEVGSW